MVSIDIYLIYINRTTLHKPFCIWLFQINFVFARFIPVVCSNFLILIATQYFVVWIYHNLFLYCTLNRHLGTFQFGINKSNAATFLYMPLGELEISLKKERTWHFSQVRLRSGWLSHRLCMCLASVVVTNKNFHSDCHNRHSPKVWDFWSLRILANTWCCLFFSILATLVGVRRYCIVVLDILFKKICVRWPLLWVVLLPLHLHGTEGSKLI